MKTAIRIITLVAIGCIAGAQSGFAQVRPNTETECWNCQGWPDYVVCLTAQGTGAKTCNVYYDGEHFWCQLGGNCQVAHMDKVSPSGTLVTLAYDLATEEGAAKQGDNLRIRRPTYVRGCRDIIIARVYTAEQQQMLDKLSKIIAI